MCDVLTVRSLKFNFKFKADASNADAVNLSMG